MNVYLTNHAVERYVERCRPLEFKLAKAELIRLVREFGEERPRPEWISHRAGEPDVWVAVGDDVWLPCERRGDRLVAHTVLTQGGLSDESRARRNERRERRKSKNRRASQYEHDIAVRRRDRDARAAVSA